jgi:hypothetical protein
MNDEVKTICFHFIVHRSAFIVFFSSLRRSFMVRAREGARREKARKAAIMRGAARGTGVASECGDAPVSLQQARERGLLCERAKVFPEKFSNQEELKPV